LIHQDYFGINQRAEIHRGVALPFQLPCLQAIRKRNEATVSEWNYEVLKETCEICPSAKNAREKTTPLRKTQEHAKHAKDAKHAKIYHNG
jgi:hypothetical protein